MNENLEIIYVSIEELKKFAGNPRKEKDRNAIDSHRTCDNTQGAKRYHPHEFFYQMKDIM
jgi:hypothetical protein